MSIPQHPREDGSSEISQARPSSQNGSSAILPCITPSAHPLTPPVLAQPTLNNSHRPTFPQAFLVARQTGDQFRLTLHRGIRIIPLCQAPSIMDGIQEQFHITTHKGWTIKYPGDFEHRHRDNIRRAARAMNHLVRGAGTAASIVANISSQAGNVVTSALTSLQQIVDNKDRLNRAGIDYKDMLSPQLITDVHQKEALEELLIGAAVSNEQHDIAGDGNGHTIWICHHCHDRLQRRELIDLADYLTLSQYTPLIRREPEVEVTLHNSMSVKVFTEAFSTRSNTHKIIIRINPAYFEARAEGAPRSAIVHMFNELGRVLQCQKVLTHLEIHGNSTTNGNVFGGFRAVLKCRSLEILHVSGIPCLLQEENITIKCRRLRELTFRGIAVSTEEAVNNLEVLVRMNADLERRTVT